MLIDVDRFCSFYFIFLRSQEQHSCMTAGFTFLLVVFGYLETKTERNAVNETISTATHTSIYCQNNFHSKSNKSTDVRRPEALTIANMIMKTLRHKKTPTPCWNITVKGQ